MRIIIDNVICYLKSSIIIVGFNFSFAIQFVHNRLSNSRNLQNDMFNFTTRIVSCLLTSGGQRAKLDSSVDYRRLHQHTSYWESFLRPCRYDWSTFRKVTYCKFIIQALYAFIAEHKRPLNASKHVLCCLVPICCDPFHVVGPSCGGLLRLRLSLLGSQSVISSVHLPSFSLPTWPTHFHLSLAMRSSMWCNPVLLRISLLLFMSDSLTPSTDRSIFFCVTFSLFAEF